VARESDGEAVAAGVSRVSLIGEGSTKSAPSGQVVKVPGSGECALTEEIRNIGRRPLPRIMLIFDFYDLGGASLESAAQTIPAGPLAPGAQGTFKFQFSCPANADKIDVRVPVADKFSVALINRLPKDDLRYSGSSNDFSSVRVEVADSTLCPAPATCQLKVQAGAKSVMTSPFTRDPNETSLLVSYDPILIGFLATGETALLEVPTQEKTISIPMSYDNLRRKSSESFLTRAWARLMGLGSGISE
jgi:hypothetical protein